MNPGTLETPRYAPLRKGGKVLGRLALWVQLGFLIMGMGLFLDQARDLLSDAQFTWGERRVMGVIALVTLGGCGLAGWILGQLFRIFAQVLDVLADGAEAAWRAGDLIEQHLVPTLGRIALPWKKGMALPDCVPRLRRLPRVSVPRRSGPRWPQPRRQAEQGG
jgi:hypothetical protein